MDHVHPAGPEHDGVLATVKVWPIDVGARDKEGATANLDGVCARRRRAAMPWEWTSARCRSVLTTDEQAMAWPLWLFTTREQIQMRQYEFSPRLSPPRCPCVPKASCQSRLGGMDALGVKTDP